MTTTIPHAPARHRAVLAGCLAATVGLGLASRRWPLPGLFAEYTGDALYTVAVFFALLLVRPAARTPVTALLAFLGSSLVEWAQRLDWQWLVELRATRLGALVLGQGFQWVDLLAYAAGAGIAAGGDALLVRGIGRRGGCGA